METAFRTANGLEFRELSRVPVPVEATVSFAAKRMVFRGTLTIDRQGKSYKFGDQLQIHLFTRDLPTFETRAMQNGYSRIEIAIPIHDAVNFLTNAVVNFRRPTK